MKIGLAYDLKADFATGGIEPEDCLEEYDSEETIEAISSALCKHGHDVVKMGGGRRFLEQALSELDIDLIFNTSEGFGTRSREAHVSAVCEMLRIPFTHSDPLTMAISLDKPIAKRLVSSYGISTPASVVIHRPEELACSVLPPLPLIAKPACEGSSMGLRKHSRCDDPAKLDLLVANLLRDYGEPVLVEHFLTGVEVTVGIVGNGEMARIVGMMEIAPRRVATEHFIYSFEVKRNYRMEVDYHVPPRLPSQVCRAIERLALGSYRALGCRDVARVDIRLDTDSRPHFLEINPVPGLNPVSSDLPILAARSDLAYDTLIGEIVGAALAREALQGCTRIRRGPPAT